MVMFVTIYTARVVLDTLGVDDYGIYNLVGGVVVMFTFLNGSMTACTQRYLCVAIGKKDDRYERDVFRTSIIAHLLISILFLLLAETIGLWFVSKVLKIPEGSEAVTMTVYQITLISSVTNIMRVPYNGAIVAYEKMSFFAYTGIIESLLKLAILPILVWIDADKLILYTVLIALINVIILGWFHFYVVRHFPNCRFRAEKTKRDILKEMLKFTGWSNFSSISNLGAKQGMGFIMNHFFGVAINAAIGIMNQVTSAVYGFIHNFMTAVNPPLIKLYVTKEWDQLKTLFIQSSKFAFYLMLVLSIPLILNIDSILPIWLTDVPEYTGYFCALSLVSLLPNVLGGPIWTIVQATGRISRYQMIISMIILLNLPADYILLRIGCEPYWLLVVAMIVNFLVVLVGVHFIRASTTIRWRDFLIGILMPCALSTLVAFLLCHLVNSMLPVGRSGLSDLIIVLAIDVTVVSLSVLIIGLSRTERHRLLSLIRKKS